MKAHRFIIIAGAATLFCLASCQKDEDFVLENTYHLDKLLVAEGSGFNDELYTFTLELAEEGVSGSKGNYTGTGIVVSYQFYGSKYYLESAVYPAVTANNESDASYVAEQSAVFEVENGQVTRKGISEGFVYVSKTNDSYRFGSTSKLSDGTEFKFVSGCDIVFPKLPKYKYMPIFLQAYDAAPIYVVEIGNGSLAFDGSVTGDGVLIHLEFNGISSLADGVYEPGDYKAGFLNDTYAAWGAVWDEGSRIINVAGATQSVSMYITTATITVSTLDGGLRRIEIDLDDVIYIFEGTI
jgi:hypothetical protein